MKHDRVRPLTSGARYAGPLPDGFMAQCAEYIRAYDVPMRETAGALDVDLPYARVELRQGAGGFALDLAAPHETGLHQARETALHLLDHASPGVSDGLVWTGTVARDAPPPNLHPASLRGVRRVGPRFLRVELDCAGTAALAAGGMHFSLLLPPEGRAPLWPRIGPSGRTIWPEGADALHRAAYTFVALDPAAGRFTFDVFEHDGGRTTEWARRAEAGGPAGIMGPGGGGFPPGDRILLAGDETALPAIRRILETSDPARQGLTLIEVADRTCRCEIAAPPGVQVIWLDRSAGERLADRLAETPPPAPGPGRYVWVAAEQAVVRQAKARFRGVFGVGREESYLSYYWVAGQVV